MLQLNRQGLAGNSAAARASLAAIENARPRKQQQSQITVITICFVDMGIEGPLTDLDLATLKYPYDKNRARIDEQREVWKNTRTPKKVKWPHWWAYRG